MSPFPRLIRKRLLRTPAHLLLNRIGSAKQRTSLNGNSSKQRTTIKTVIWHTERLDVSVPDDTTLKTNLKNMWYPPDRFYENTDRNFRELFSLIERQTRLLELLTNEIISLNREIRKAKFKKSKFKK